MGGRRVVLVLLLGCGSRERERLSGGGAPCAPPVPPLCRTGGAQGGTGWAQGGTGGARHREPGVDGTRHREPAVDGSRHREPAVDGTRSRNRGVECRRESGVAEVGIGSAPLKVFFKKPRGTRGPLKNNGFLHSESTFSLEELLEEPRFSLEVFLKSVFFNTRNGLF